MTHKEKVLHLLRDGAPHSHHEGYALNLILHSRVADLRKDGYVIECWKEAGKHWYRLLGGSAEFLPGSLADPPSRTVRQEGFSEERRLRTGGAPPDGPPGGSAQVGPDPASPVEGPAQQLSVFEAAA